MELPALKTLRVKFRGTPGVILKLTRALVGGALEHLEVTQEQASTWNSDEVNSAAFNSLADMLERRADVPGCSRLKSFNAHDSGLEETDSATQTRQWNSSKSSVGKRLLSVAFVTCSPRFCRTSAWE